jgi:hypothetical protein
MDPLRSRKNRVKLTVEIPVDVLKRVRKAARDERRALWVIVWTALEQYLEEAEKQRRNTCPGKGGGNEQG